MLRYMVVVLGLKFWEVWMGCLGDDGWGRREGMMEIGVEDVVEE